MAAEGHLVAGTRVVSRVIPWRAEGGGAAEAAGCVGDEGRGGGEGVWGAQTGEGGADQPS